MKQCNSLANFEPEPSDYGTLQKIAAAIGVSINAFAANPGRIVFHVEPSGCQWLLQREATGALVVRHFLPGTDDQGEASDSVSGFLVSNAGTPPGDALAALVDRALSTCIGFV